MKKVTLRALKGSIRKWKQIRDQDVVDQGMDNCTLCLRFCPNEDRECTHSTGELCPVFDITGGQYCIRTPYQEWSNAGGYGNTAFSPKLKDLAQKEINFLESLLPQEGS